MTLPESFSENWLSPMLADFSVRNPRVELYLEPSNTDVDLRAGKFDLAIRYGETTDAQLDERHLFGDCIVPVCSPGFARHHNILTDQRSLQGIPLIHVTQRTKDPGWIGFEAWGAAFGFDPEHLSHGVRFSKTGSGLQAALAGQGLVLCGLVEAFNALPKGALILPFGRSVQYPTRYAYRLLCPRTHKKTDQMQLFIDWMVEKANEFYVARNAYFEEL